MRTGLCGQFVSADGQDWHYIPREHWPPVDEDADQNNKPDDGEGGDDSQGNHGFSLFVPHGTNPRFMAAVTDIWREGQREWEKRREKRECIQ